MKPTALVCTRCEHQEPRWRSTCSICGDDLTPVYSVDVVDHVARLAASFGWTNGRGNGKDRNGIASAKRAIATLLDRK